MGTQPRCVIYTRVSTDEQATDGHSLDAQRDICTRFAEQRGWSVVRVISDEGISGTRADRPGFVELLRLAEHGGCDVILTHKLDRFSRNIVDVLTTFKRMNDLGVSYASATEQFDFTTAFGKVILVILAAFAEWYIENLSEETKKGKRQRAAKGLWNGPIPFGYERTEHGQLTPHPTDADGVRLAFARYSAGSYTDAQIARILNDAGHRITRQNGDRVPFNKDTVRNLLQNRFYCGQVVFYGSDERGRKNRRQPQEIYEGQHPAIISDEDYEAIQAIRKARYAGARGRRDTSHAVAVYPASELLYCAECGTRLRGRTTNGRRRYYDAGPAEYGKRCGQPRSYLADQTELVLGELVMSFKLPPTWRDKVLAHLETDEPKLYERQRRTYRNHLKRLQQVFVWGDINDDEYRLERARIETALNALRPPDHNNILAAGEALTNIRTIWPLATPEEKQKLLRICLEAVYIQNGVIVAITPRPDFYSLIKYACGPDGERARKRIRPMMQVLRTHPPAFPFLYPAGY